MELSKREVKKIEYNFALTEEEVVALKDMVRSVEHNSYSFTEKAVTLASEIMEWIESAE